MAKKDPEGYHDRWMPYELASEERQRDPYSWFEEMRQEGPVRYDQQRDAFDVFHYDAEMEVMTDWERFTREDTSFLDGAMMDRGPPEHTELRAMAEDYFLPGAIREYRDDFEERADELLDEAVNGNGRLEFVDDIAKPLPIIIIADMLGVPSEKMDTFRDWSTTLTLAPSERTEAEIKRVEQQRGKAMEQINDFFAREIEKRENDPRDDLISHFLEAERESAFIDREKTIAQCGMLLIAGNITTTTYLANALWTFIEEDVIDDINEETLDLDDALQEVLRYRSPVINTKRWVTEDTELAGMEIHEGARIVGYIPSANRDERVYEYPDEFRPEQDYPKEPVPFGKGIHYCLGAPLANMEAKIMMSKFLDRIEGAELLTDQIEPFYSSEINGPAKLPIRIST